jgi:D-arabinose 1-dehydrogenase-like Zn-dependent alcohol dehydrogenase
VKAWQLDRLGGELTLRNVPTPQPRPGSVLVRIEASLLAFDMVGQARDPNATLAALHSLRRGGRLVLMGSMTTELPLPYTTVMLNNLEILGQFMYPKSAYRRLLELLRGGLLDITRSAPAFIRSRRFPKPWKPPPPLAISNAS